MSPVGKADREPVEDEEEEDGTGPVAVSEESKEAKELVRLMWPEVEGTMLLGHQWEAGVEGGSVYTYTSSWLRVALFIQVAG